MYRTIRSEPSPKTNNGLRGYDGNPFEQCQCMTMQYRHHWGWFKRGVGVVLLFIAISFLIWNETRAVESSRSYHDGMRSIIIIKDPDAPMLPENDGKLVHISGYLKIMEPLEDPPYGVSIYAVKLKRRVQMYQWVEEKSGPELASVVKYNKAWKDKLSDSRLFQVSKGHENTNYFPIQSQIRVNYHVFLGNYRLGPELKERFNNFVQFTSGERPESQDIKMHMGLYYHSSDIWNPSIGDVRIQFSFAGQTNSYISIIAMQFRDELRPYTSDAGAQVAFLHDGKRKHDEILKREHTVIAVQSWVYRIIAYVIAAAGTYLASKIITIINRRNKIVKNLMAMGPQKFSVVVSAFICFSIIGSLWFSHKPLFSILLVTFACSLLLYYAFTGPDVPKESKISLPQYNSSSQYKEQAAKE